jgi:hypothetical protein
MKVPKTVWVGTRPRTESSRPVGPAMKARDGIEFLVALTGIDVSKLNRSGQPTDVADLRHISGFCYELCRFSQAAQTFYESLVSAATRNPAILELRLRPLRDLIEAVADGSDFEMVLKESTTIRIEGSHFHRQQFQSPLPFVFRSPVFAQGLVVTAAFYLSLTHRTMLVRRCPESGCQKIFLAIRKTRKFCSHKCASAASIRAYQERQATKKAAGQKESER